MLKVLNNFNSTISVTNAVLLSPRTPLLHFAGQLRVKSAYSVGDSELLTFTEFGKGVRGRSCRKLAPLLSPRRAYLQAMASAAESTSIVEHVVMFRVKEDVEPEKVDAMIRGLRKLGELQPPLEGLIQMSCGPALPPKSPKLDSKAIPFTHALHTRFVSRDALDHYSGSPAHVDVVNNLVKPVVADVCAVDWEASVAGATKDLGVGLVHSVLFKLKDGTGEEAIEEMLTGLRGHVGTIPGLRDLTIGKNFSPARAKGFEWGLIARFATPEDLAVYSKDRGHLRVMLRLFPNIESFAAVDFDCKAETLAKI